MPSCVVPTCQNATGHNNKKQGITFHKFPADDLRKDIWTKIIRNTRLNEFWNPSKVSVVCSDHFTKENIYFTKKGLKRLRIEAVPSNNMVLGSNLCAVTKKILSESLTSKVVQKSDSQAKYDGVKTNITKSYLDSSKILQLKSDLRRITVYCKKYTKKIKMLQRKNIRLAKKNHIYKTTLNKLENKHLGEDDYLELLSQKILTAKDLNSIKKKSSANETASPPRSETLVRNEY